MIDKNCAWAVRAAVCTLMVACQLEPDPGGIPPGPPPPVLDGGAGGWSLDAAMQGGGGADAAAPGDAAAPPTDTPRADGGLQDAAVPPRDAGPMGDAGELRDGSADAAAPGDAGTAFDMLAQQCVDRINSYRATVGLVPLRRATPEQEACSDRGAQKDALARSPHSSAGSCKGLGAQNSCPGWGFGPRTAFSSLSAALDGCLQSMWEEGPPPGSVASCIRDYAGCFLKHGHYINMTDTNSKVVACGFYDMGKNTFWMNQDFGS